MNTNKKTQFFFLFLALFLFSSFSHCTQLLVPFGNDSLLGHDRDSSISGVDEGHIKLDLKTPFLINQEKFSSVFVNVDGILTFHEPSSSFDVNEIQGPFIGPFWGDVDLSGVLKGDKEGNTLYYRVSEGSQDIEWVRQALEEAVGYSVDWRPKTVVVATWNRVGHFMSQTSTLNTFQVVLATDGQESFAFFNYPSNSLNWWISEQGQDSSVGFRTQNDLFLIPMSSIEQVLIFMNTTNARVSGRLIFKFGGSRPLLSGFSLLSPPCFFGGGSLSISGHGFVNSTSLKCRFSNALRNFETPAKFISFNEVSCDVPAWDSRQMLNVSVSNEEGIFSEDLPFLVGDCILSFSPIRTCFGGGSFSVESFPVSWESNNTYSCHFGELTTEGEVQDEILRCPLPEFVEETTQSSVLLSVSLIEGRTGQRVSSGPFGTLQLNSCDWILNRIGQCLNRKMGVFWETPLNTHVKGVLTYPSGKEKELEFGGTYVDFQVPEDGVYHLKVLGYSTSFEVIC